MLKKNFDSLVKLLKESLRTNGKYDPSKCISVQQLAKIEKESGLSQKALVAKMNLLGSMIEHTGYSKIESGIRNIKVTDLVALQRVYNVDFTEFFKGVKTHEQVFASVNFAWDH